MPFSSRFGALAASVSSHTEAAVSSMAATVSSLASSAASVVLPALAEAAADSGVGRVAPSYRVFDLDRLGVTLYFLATVYAVFFVLSVYRNIKINQFSTQAVTEKVLFRAVSGHLAVRTLGFAVLSMFSLVGRTNKMWYPLQAVLFTLPEQCTISIYVIIFLTWLETYVFSHAQRIVRSRVRFRSIAWLCFFALTFLQYVIVFILYFLLAIKEDVFDESMSDYIQWSCAIVNTFFPLCALAVAAVFAFRILRNAALASPLARELVYKITVVFAVWSAARLVRGVVFILSITYEWQQSLATNLLGITIVSILAVSEFLPLLLLLDWALIGILLIGDEISVDPATEVPSLPDSASSADLAAAAAGNLNFSADGYGALTALPASGAPLLSVGRDGIDLRAPGAGGSKYGGDGAGAAGSVPLLADAGSASDAAARYNSAQISAPAGGGRGNSHFLQPSALSSAATTQRIDLDRLVLPRAFFASAAAAAATATAQAEGGSAAAAAAAAATAANGGSGGAQQILCDTGVWTTAVGVMDDQRVLVKRFRLEGMRAISVEELAVELDEKSRIAHSHIVRFIGVARQGNHVYAVSEYVARRSLFDLLRQTAKDLSPATIVRVASEVATAMEALHARGQIHVHLKSRNVLLDENMSIKVCDVGVKSVKTFAEVMLGHRFLTAWSAPEVLLGATPTKASDVYSFGVLCWELTARQEPFQGYTVAELVDAVGKSGTRLKVPTADELAGRSAGGGTTASRVLSPLFLTMLGRCFMQPDLRPSFTDIRTMLARCKNEMGL